MRSLINLERLGPKFWWLEQPSTTSQVCRSWEFQAWILGFIESDLPQRIERSHRELRMGISTNIRFWRTSFRFSCFLPTLRGVERFCFGVRKENKQQENKKWIYWRWHKTTVAHRGLVDSRWSKPNFQLPCFVGQVGFSPFRPTETSVCVDGLQGLHSASVDWSGWSGLPGGGTKCHLHLMIWWFKS